MDISADFTGRSKELDESVAESETSGVNEIIRNVFR